MPSKLTQPAAARGGRGAPPKFKSFTVLANVTNPSLNRDSCSSVKFGDKVFWTCRDTSVVLDNGSYFGLWASSAGWTEFAADGTPAFERGGNSRIGPGSTGTNTILPMKGPSPTVPLFYPLAPDMSPGAGCCDDGSRWVGWPDSPPLVTDTAPDGTISAYTWVTKTHLRGLAVENAEQPTSLYRVTYKPTDDLNVLPTVEAVDYEFWPANKPRYGTCGNLVRDGYVYLYGELKKEGFCSPVGLARVPVSEVENKSCYEFFVDGRHWTRDLPDISDRAAVVNNAGAGGQGTYYYSERHGLYIWIGQGYPSVCADFYMTTASRPEGPWADPVLLCSAENGNAPLGGYSLQAHPHLLRAEDNGIYVTWTQNFATPEPGEYVTPMAYIAWQ